MKFLSHTKEEAFEIIKELVARFKQNEKSYTSVSYDESNTRTDFIDKFFEALNWDVRNDNGFAERFREVVREDKVVINGQTKAPDYSFRLGGQKIFFVEAKKPSVNIKDDIAPAYQVRRYAYTAKLPLSILTDFEEFAVYDTQIKPNSVDKASTARIQFMRYTEYEENFEYLWNTFSKDAVQTGSFDRYCESSKNKRGTSEIDNELLSTIEKWRLDLAKNIALRNPSLNLRNLNIAVQKIIDRIIFLRIAEDKDMEDLETLKKACNSENAYESLKRVFSIANDKYNSGLFATESWIENLVIDSKVLKDITNELYYPNCPYAWVALPVEVLGNIYEKFLGSEINFKNVKNGHTVTVEEKPEIKKAGGVFYTPTYIVKYIVEQTIGKKLANCTPETAASVTVCDPACGSGSFLVGAFKFLLNWYLDQYTKTKTEEAKNLKAGKIINTKNGIALSIQEKKRILTTHIFGVDIDAQAVEVTKLSLFLQMLEGEGKQENSLFRESDMHVLPYLGDNIKCGNSLIGSDFYATQDLSLFEEDAMYKVNAFDWDKEFPQIFGKNCHTDSENLRFSSGFECVIGNPPYLRVQGLRENYETESQFLETKYKSATGRFDFYVLFMERGFSLLNKNGLLSFILPHKFINSDFGTGIRQFIYKNKALNFITHFGAEQVFATASVYTCVIGLSHDNKNFKFTQVSPKQISEDVAFEEFDIEKLQDTSRWSFQNSENGNLIEKLNLQKNTVKKVFKGVFQGIITGDNKVFYIQNCVIKDDILYGFSEALNESIELEAKICKPILTGKTINKYYIKNKNEYILYPYILENCKTRIIEESLLKSDYPKTFNYFTKLKKRLSSRGTEKMKYPCWYSLWNFRNILNLECMRIVTPDICYGTSMFFENGSHYHNDTSYAFILEEPSETKYKFYLAILNSPITWFYLKETGTSLRGGYFRFKTKYLENFPLPTATESQQQELANLATLMMEAVKKQQDAKSDQEKNVCKMRVEAIDTQINAKVYALYGLTKEEIAIVEKSK